MEPKKKCTKCKEEKLLKDFRRNNKIKDGYMNWCKTCERNREKGRDLNMRAYAQIYFTHTGAF